MNTVRKNVSITKTQDEFLRLNNISLSKLTQAAIRKQMDDIRFAKLTARNLEEMEHGSYEEMEFDEFLKQAKEW